MHRALLPLAVANVLILGGGVARVATHPGTEEFAKPVAQIEKAAGHDLAGAEQIELAGKDVDFGDEGDTPETFDFVVEKGITSDGSPGAYGYVEEEGVSAFLRRTADGFFVAKTTAGDHPAREALTEEDGWVKVPPGSGTAQLVDGLDDLVHGPSDSDISPSDTKKLVTIDGRRLIEITSGGDDGSIGYVTDTDPPRIVRIADPHDPGQFVLFSYPDRVPIPDPAHFATQSTTT